MKGRVPASHAYIMHCLAAWSLVAFDFGCCSGIKIALLGVVLCTPGDSVGRAHNTVQVQQCVVLAHALSKFRAKLERSSWS